MSPTPHEHHIAQRIELARTRLRAINVQASNLGAQIAVIDAELTVRELELPAETLAAHARLALTETEWSVVWLLAAEALDTECQRLFAGLEMRGTGISLRTLRSLVYPSAYSRSGHVELGASGTLRQLGIIERDDGGPADLHEARQSWRLSTRFLGFLQGDHTPDASLRGVLAPSDPPPPSELAIGVGVLEEARHGYGRASDVLIITGPSSSGRRSLLRRLSRDASTSLLEVDCRRLARETPALVRQMRAIAVELRLLGKTLLLANLDALVDETPARLDVLGTDLVPLVPAQILATASIRPRLTWDRPVIAVDIGRPTTGQRAALWKSGLGVDEEDATRLAESYPLAPGMIHHAAIAARARAGERTLDLEHVQAGIRSVLDDRLGHYARRVTVTQTWDDIVLPNDQLNTVVELMARIRQRSTVYETWGFGATVGKGLGISALFSDHPAPARR